jgi:uncharacterized protein (TIGR02145 family)
MKIILKNSIFLIIINLAVAVLLSSCSIDCCADKGVVINGVKWAKSNVDRPKRFASKPEHYGRLYQWNSKKSWKAKETDVLRKWKKANRTRNIITGVWEKGKDPSPKGWHIPGKADFEKLLDKEKVNIEWMKYNGTYGYKFTDKESKNWIFLPAAGVRSFSSGTYYNSDIYGFYWTNDINAVDEENATSISLDLDSEMATLGYSNCNYAFSLRCVADN